MWLCLSVLILMYMCICVSLTVFVLEITDVNTLCSFLIHYTAYMFIMLLTKRVFRYSAISALISARHTVHGSHIFTNSFIHYTLLPIITKEKEFINCQAISRTSGPSYSGPAIHYLRNLCTEVLPEMPLANDKKCYG